LVTLEELLYSNMLVSDHIGVPKRYDVSVAKT
jgi:hypothetical protein